jgi:hypothetical protein
MLTSQEFASPRMTDDDMFSRTEEEMMKNFDPQAVREKLREMKKSKFGSQQLIEVPRPVLLPQDGLT